MTNQVLNREKIEHPFIDLFAGCGGLSLGLEQVGFTPVFFSEIHDNALATFQSNRINQFPHLSNESHFVKDVKELVLNDQRLQSLKDTLRNQYGIRFSDTKSDLDLIAGGPPCQGFSGIGYRRSYSVEKAQLPSNHLYQDMAFLIRELMPKAFLFENVRGLINARWSNEGSKGEIWEDVQRTFNQIPGYETGSKLIWAKDFGVPQNRPRVILLGIRQDIYTKKFTGWDSIQSKLLFNPDIANPPSILELLSDLVDPFYSNGGSTTHYPHDPLTEIQKVLRTNTSGITLLKGEPLTEHDYSKHSPRIISKFQHMIQNNGEIPEQYKTKKFRQLVLPKKWGKNGPNITATSLPDDYVHWIQPRSITVREWARLQTFPDSYQFFGNRTTGGLRRAGNPRKSLVYRDLPKYTQIGNAVPVKLAKILGQRLLSIMEN